MNKKFDLYVKNFEVKVDKDIKNDGVIRIKGFANKYKDDNGQVVVDRSQESVLPTAYKLENFMKNPILLYQHNYNQPIGKVININLTDKGLEIEAEVYKEANPSAFTLIQKGVLKALSIGFVGKDFLYDDHKDIWYWTDIELYEISVVSIPDNQDSLFTELLEAPCQDGICLLGIKDYNKKRIQVKEKAIKNSEISTRAWSEVDKTKLGQDLAELGKESYIKEAYLVVGDIEKRSTWKFPHHELKGEDLVVNKNGVTSAYAALQGARNNPDITSEDKKASAQHLLKHYREMKKQGLVEEIPSDLEEMAKGIFNVDTKNAPQVNNKEDNQDSNVTNNDTVNPQTTNEGGNQEDNSQNKTDDDKQDENNNPEPKIEVSKELLENFITEQAKNEEGLNTLLELYSKLEQTINESLKDYLENNKE